MEAIQKLIIIMIAVFIFFMSIIGLTAAVLWFAKDHAMVC